MTAGYAGQGSAVIEQRWDFTKTYKAFLQMLAVQETRDGKIARETLYFNSESMPFEI
jgi:hypothetical protein